ncbi:hypothetical protein Tco_0450127 [Tanacetum coccineum]
MLNHSKAEPIGMLKDVLCQVGVTTLIAKFLILDMPVDQTVLIIIGGSFLHTCGGIIKTLKGTTSIFDGVCHQKFYVAEIQNNGEESDSDDEEEYYLKRDEMGRPFYGPNLISHFDRNDPMELNNAKISRSGRQISQKYAALQNLTMPRSAGMHDDEASSSSRINRARVTKTVKEALLGRVFHDFLLWNNCNRTLKSRRASDINEPIYTKLCQEFYSTYEFDEVVPDNKLMAKKVIKFRLCGRAHSLRCLKNDDHFNANQYWLSISSEEGLLFEPHDTISVDEFHSLITTELATTALGHIKVFLQRYIQTHAVAFQPPAHAQAADPEITALKVKFEKSLISTNSFKHTILRKQGHDDHPDGPPEREKNAKKQKTTLDFDAWVKDQEVDDDEVVSKEATPDFLAELEILGKAREPTIIES